MIPTKPYLLSETEQFTLHQQAGMEQNLLHHSQDEKDFPNIQIYSERVLSLCLKKREKGDTIPLL